MSAEGNAFAGFSFASMERLRAYAEAHPVGIPDDDAIRRMADASLSLVRKDPVLLRYARHMTYGDGRNTEPWMAIGEQRLMAYSVLEKIVERERVFVDGIQMKRMSATQAAFSTAVRLLCATPYQWSLEMRALADEAPLPSHTISRDILQLPAMFWSWEVAYGDDPQNNWMLLWDEGDGFSVLFDITRPGRESEGGGSELMGSFIRYGGHFPDDFADEPPEHSHAVERILARCGFINSPYVDTTARAIPRPMRREVARASRKRGGPEPEEPLVRVITLRRPAATGTAAEPEGEDAGFPHSHRWWVSGHFRAQWYPSLEAHRVIWIAPYLKGPESAPLLGRVFRVVR